MLQWFSLPILCPHIFKTHKVVQSTKNILRDTSTEQCNMKVTFANIFFCCFLKDHKTVCDTAIVCCCIPGYTIHRCGRPCRTQQHYHCLYSQSTILRKPDFITHLGSCKYKHVKRASATDACNSTPTAVATGVAQATAIAAPSTTAIAATSVPTTSAIVRPVTKSGIRVGPKVLQKCPKCHLTFYRKKLKRHIERRHTAKMMDISSSSHLKSECWILYAVHKSIHGASTPLHVQIKIWGEQHHVSCELGECQANMELAWRSGLQS